MIAVREFTSADDLKAHYKALFARPVTVVPLERVWPTGALPLTLEMSKVAQIKSAIAFEWGVTVDEINGIDRRPHVDKARLEAYRAIREAFPHWSVSQIARSMGKTFNAANSALKRLGLK